MTAMERVVGGATEQSQPQQATSRAVLRLNPVVVLQRQLNLESVKTRAISFFKAISCILEDLDVIGRTNAVPRWQDLLGQFSVSTKLLPELEMDENAKRYQLLHGMQNLPVATQTERLKARIEMIGAACESAEKVIADTCKAQFATRQGTTTLPTIDKVQAAKIHEQENLLRNAVNHGEGLRVPVDQRKSTSSLPVHLVDVLNVNEGAQTSSDSSGTYMKNTPPLSSNISTPATLLQAPGAQLIGRAVASPSAATANNSFENASPLQYVNSPRSGSNMMNTPSPQQHSLQHQQQQQQQLQQQRQKMMQLPQNQQQLLAQQQFRQAAMPGLGQNQLSQLNDLQGQAQQKYQQLHSQHQMQFSQPLGTQHFQGRQLQSAAMQHGMVQGQLSQANALNRQLNQFSSPANSALFNAAQSNPNTQMIPNMSAMMSSQSLLPRMQYGMAGNRNLASQNLSDQMFNMGGTNSGSMMPIQQQQAQHGSQGAFGSMPQNASTLQTNMVPLQNTPQNHPNFQQQRPPTQQ